MSKKILICDDDKDIAEVTEAILEESGYEVSTVHSCDGIFELIEKQRPDLILMDLKIPELGGEKITRDLKANAETKDIVILIFSANRKLKEVAENTGADGFINKPYDIGELVDTIEQKLNERS